MRVPRIYCVHNLQTGAEIELNNNASRHVLHVLRLRLGAEIALFNGTGGQFISTLQTVRNDRAVVRIENFVSREVESSLKIHLAQGISRAEKMDYTIQKAVELGIYRIIPLFT